MAPPSSPPLRSPLPQRPRRAVRHARGTASAPLATPSLATCAAQLAAALLAALLLLAFRSPTHAAEAKPPLPAPVGEVLLVIRGAIERPNVGEEARLDLAALESLPRHTVTTINPWAGGARRHTFEGVRLDVLLDAVGARSTRFEASALDDYRATFEGVDLARYPIILAWLEDGRMLDVRRLGPLRIMFPFSDHPELLSTTNMSMAVWQLIAMDVR